MIITFVVGCQQRSGWPILQNMSVIERKALCVCAVYHCFFSFFCLCFCGLSCHGVSGGGWGGEYFANRSVIEHKRVTCFALCFFPVFFWFVFLWSLLSRGFGGVGGAGYFANMSVIEHKRVTCFALAIWKELKKYVPTSINNKPQVLNVYVRQFQW